MPPESEPKQQGEVPVPLAPARRFATARSSLGQFAGNGSREALGRAVGHYVGTGLGGSRTALRRLGGTIRTADTLNFALSQLAAGQRQPQLDRTILSGKSARGVIAAIVEAVRPGDGTQDGEAARAALNFALSDVLTKFPDANLVDLSDAERAYAIECYIARDVYNRFYLDLGATLQDRAPSVAAALARSREVFDYIRQTVAAAFRNLATKGQAMAGPRIAQIVQSALRDALTVFEEYVR